MPVIFDVGANDGNSCFHLTRNKNNIVYAFEPTPKLWPRLEGMEKFAPNYHLVKVAVSNVSGTAEFNVVTGDEWVGEGESGGGGCSSLCQLGDSMPNLAVKEKIPVKVITLEEFIDENNIEKVDYLHCDVQGRDLEVIMGLGKHKDKVVKGCVEMPRCISMRIYEDQIYDAGDAVRWLNENGFLVDSIEAHGGLVNEVDIYFHRMTDEDKVMKPFKPVIF
jgi:FkbM family methyltransferase